MKRRLVLVLLLGCVGAVALTVLVLRAGDEPAEAPVAVNLEACRNLRPDASRDCWTREFLAAVEGRDDPRPAVASITDAAWNEGGFLLSSCHGLMHTVGRTYARETGITLANLKDYLPRSNDPGCSAGFAHGARHRRRAADRSATSARRVGRLCATTGHALPALQLHARARARVHADLQRAARACARALLEARHDSGPDCAQGAFHDYWFAVGGDDDTEADRPETDPRELCGAQKPEYVRQCWYRAFVDNRPPGAIEIDSPETSTSSARGSTGSSVRPA